MEVTVRRAEIKDCDSVIGLLLQIAGLHHKARPDIFKDAAKKYGREEFEAILSDDNRPVFVAEDEKGYILGYCFCMVVRYAGHAVFKDYNSLYIDDFCVDEDCRGQGVGKRLFVAAREYARDAGLYNIDLNVWEFNESAMRFYESCGFATQRRRMELIL